ncbi:MAG: DsrE family protein [Acidobacteriota bacterium]|jgi:predicted peroxiredoxin|nr:DsrE family protein [Acidobacteriota bacterium]
MDNLTAKLVIVASRGHDDERATVSWTIANGGLTAGLEVTMFLVSAGIDLVRKGAADHVRMNPFDPPMKELIEGFMARGGKVLVCPPCAKMRGYTQDTLLDGVTIVGSAALHALIREGAATLSF